MYRPLWPMLLRFSNKNSSQTASCNGRRRAGLSTPVPTHRVVIEVSSPSSGHRLISHGFGELKASFKEKGLLGFFVVVVKSGLVARVKKGPVDSIPAHAGLGTIRRKGWDVAVPTVYTSLNYLPRFSEKRTHLCHLLNR